MKAATYCKTYSAIELARNKQRHMLVLKFQRSHKLAHKRAAKCIRSTVQITEYVPAHYCFKIQIAVHPEHCEEYSIRLWPQLLFSTVVGTVSEIVN